MRFMMLVKATRESEAGAMPAPDVLAAMGAFNESMIRAGVLLAGEGLRPSSLGARVTFPGGKRPVVTDGPFAEAKELIAGYRLIQVKSKAEAIEWARRCPPPMGPGKDAEIEVRQVFEESDFPADVVEQVPEVFEAERRFRSGGTGPASGAAS